MKIEAQILILKLEKWKLKKWFGLVVGRILFGKSTPFSQFQLTNSKHSQPPWALFWSIYRWHGKINLESTHCFCHCRLLRVILHEKWATYPARDIFRTRVVYSFSSTDLHLRNTSTCLDPLPHIQPSTGFHPGREPCAVNNQSISAAENKTCGRAGGRQIGRYFESFLSPRRTDYERISLPIVCQRG